MLLNIFKMEWIETSELLMKAQQKFKSFSAPSSFFSFIKNLRFLHDLPRYTYMTGTVGRKTSFNNNLDFFNHSQAYIFFVKNQNFY